jgi:hypothetical protein
MKSLLLFVRVFSMVCDNLLLLQQKEPAATKLAQRLHAHR